ncbi:hypothetical protein MMC13_005306 [Lambiella insularis]|nr:hypothetical protein [Lambiella insularis]
MDEMFRINNFAQGIRMPCRALLEKRKKHYTPISSVPNWYEYYSRIADRSVITGFVRSDFSLDLDLKGNALSSTQATEYWMHLRFATETSTMPLTILSALEDCLSDLAHRESLLVHVLGANLREAMNMVVFEELLHILPALRHLHFVLIGPDSLLPLEQTRGSGNSIVYECCPNCISEGCTRSSSGFTGLYHNYGKTAQYQKPDLAVLFHSGRSQDQIESWAPTTRFLVDSETLTLCTSQVLREATEEVQELQKLRANIVKRPEINKWQSLIPQLELISPVEHDVHYLNYYRYIFQGKVKA